MYAALTYASLFAISTLSPIALNVVLGCLAVYALRGRNQAIRALLLIALLRAANGVLVKQDSATTVVAWIACSLAAIRILTTLQRGQSRLLAPLWLFAAVAAFLSYFSSAYVSISLFKSAIFALVVPATIAGFTGQSEEERRDFMRWSQSLLLTLLVASALTLPLTSISGAVNGSFQGLLNHPQAFGILIAPIAAWAITGLLTDELHNLPRQLAFAAGVVILMFLTRARTSAVACGTGVAIAYFTLYLRQRAGQDSTRRVRAAVVLTILAAMLAIAAASSDQFRNLVRGFVFKNSGANTVSESFKDTRGQAMQAQFTNFLRHPLLGNGFGVYTDTNADSSALNAFGLNSGEQAMGIRTLWGIPISASVEKGVSITALLEETGIIGAVVFLSALILLAKEAHKAKDLRMIAVFWAVLFVNSGENVIFSVGGMGLYVWVVLGICVAEQAHRIQGVEPYSAPRSLATSDRYPNLLR